MSFLQMITLIPAVDDGIWTWFHIKPRKCFFFWNGPWFNQFNQQNLTRDHFFLLDGTRTGIHWAEVFFQLGKWWIIDHNKSWMECWVTRMRAWKPQDINQLTMQTFNLIIVKFKDICHFGSRLPPSDHRNTCNKIIFQKARLKNFFSDIFWVIISPVGITFMVLTHWNLFTNEDFHRMLVLPVSFGRRCGNSTRAVERSKKCWGSRDGKNSQGRNTTFWFARAKLILLMIWKRFWCKSSGSI